MPPAGIEPAAPGLGILCSIRLSYEGIHPAGERVLHNYDHVQLAYSFHYGHDDQKARYHQDKAKSLITNAQQQQDFDELQRALGGGKGPGDKGDGRKGGKGPGDRDGGGKGSGGNAAPSLQFRFGRG